MVSIEDKMKENWLRWFRYVNQRPTDAPIIICDYETEAQGKRVRERPRKTLKATIRKDIEYSELMEDLAQNLAQ